MNTEEKIDEAGEVAIVEKAALPQKSIRDQRLEALERQLADERAAGESTPEEQTTVS